MGHIAEGGSFAGEEPVGVDVGEEIEETDEKVEAGFVTAGEDVGDSGALDAHFIGQAGGA